MAMSENRKLLLAIAARNGGYLKAETARDLYSSKQSARSAIKSLELKGFLSRHEPGVFKLEKLPMSVRREYDVTGETRE